MQSYSFFKTFLVIHSVTCAAALIAANQPRNEEKICGGGKSPARITARHIESNGIGYNQGYTTVEGFYSPFYSSDESKWVPFLDLRGHVFNNGKMAANAGLGCRYIGMSTVFGINAYYDYRNTKRLHYNQVGAGLEALGRIWDFRINGYLPIGEKITPYRDTKFEEFKHHHIYISRKRDFALKAANAEVGLHVDHFKNVPFYFAAGPYYLTGNGKTSWGGSLRAAIDFSDYVTVEGNTSYDTLFHWIGQGQISLNIPLGPKRKVTKNSYASCGEAIALSKRAVQRVDRMEIIPVDKQRVKSKAINPATDDPWIVWFVDNTSSSEGTFESPFPTLVQAQNASASNQIIYVFPGDGTMAGMDAGITLKNSQMFLGASVKHPVPTTSGEIIIPSMASKAPRITNFSGNVVTVSDKDVVSGFTITTTADESSGVFGNQISNLCVDHNKFLTAPGITTNGIAVFCRSGKVSVNHNFFDGFMNFDGVSTNGNGIYFEVDAGNLVHAFNMHGNRFINISNPLDVEAGTGVFLQMSGGSLHEFNFSHNCFSNLNSDPNFTSLAAGVNVDIDADSFVGDICGFNNVFSDLNGSNGIIIDNDHAILENINISDNLFVNLNASDGIQINAEHAILENVNLSKNTFTNLNGSSGIECAVDSTTENINISDNLLVNLAGFSLGISISPTTYINTITISNNQFSNISDTSVGISAAFDSTVDSVFVNKCRIAGNNFNGSSNVTDGYAVTIFAPSTSGIPGDICLQFVDNTAKPINTPPPYVFQQFLVNPMAPLTLHRTIDSNSSTNIGQIEIIGPVGAPGSCSIAPAASEDIDDS